MITAAFMIVLDTFKAMFFKIAFKEILERFMQRVIIWGGDRLVKMTTNTLDDQTWDDIKTQLQGKKLTVFDAQNTTNGDWST